jgi:ABC-type transporter Mla MlaB component
MKKTILSLFSLLAISSAWGQNANQRPLIQNLHASVNWTTKILTIQYDVADAENDPLQVSVFFSDNGGKTYNLSLSPSGDVGYPVAPGTNRTITVDVTSLAANMSTYTVRLVADDKMPVNIQELVNAVDSNRLAADLHFVEGIRHVSTGPVHLKAVRDSLTSLFQSKNLYTADQTFIYSVNYTGHNIFGTLPGTVAADSVVVVDAHYDTVNVAPGADDNGSGTVGVMEIARLLSAYPSEKTLRFMAFDMEEFGRVGSIKYAASGIGAGEHIKADLNFEMIGYYSTKPNSQTLPSGFNLLFPDAYNAISNDQFRGDFIANVGNTASTTLANAYQNAATQYVPGLKVSTVLVPGTGTIAPDLRRSDHASFWDAGYPALMLTDGANFRNLCYHTAQDTFDNKLDVTFMSQVVQATLATAAQIAGIHHGDWKTTSFQNLTPTAVPDPCQFKVYIPSDRRDVIYLQAPACNLTGLTLDLFDSKGSLVFREALPVLSAELETVHFSALTPGVYLAKIGYNGGSHTEKLFVH